MDGRSWREKGSGVKENLVVKLRNDTMTPCDFVNVPAAKPVQQVAAERTSTVKVKLQCEIVSLVNCGLWLSAESVVLKKKTVKQGQPIQ